MPWSISSINNATHVVNVTRHDGKMIQFTVPETHHDKQLKQEYIKQQCEAHDHKVRVLKIRVVLVVVSLLLIAGAIVAYMRVF